MLSIALKNLLHDKTRLVFTTVGVTVAVVLIFAQVGVYLGFMQNASSVIDHTDADLWITSLHSPNFDWARSIPERRLYQAREVPGVAWTEKFLFAWAVMKLETGGTEQVQLLGFNPVTGRGGPWAMAEGRPEAVKGGKRMIVDVSAFSRLGRLRIGDTREVAGRKVDVVGISEGAKSLTTAPILFMAYETVKELAPYYVGPDETVFILVGVAPGEDPRVVRDRLRAALRGVDVYTKAEYSWKTRRYWTLETGMGMGFLLTALLAFVVGAAVAGQTLYTATMEHLREYGTLKAIGATNWALYRIVGGQALVFAVVGYGLGLGATLLLVRAYEGAGIDMVVPEGFMVAMFFVTLVMCLGASLFSIRKAVTVDPMMVFRA
ncbi:MAG: ABC transporter permease [Nitrospirae bacterium]|nr:ABC transporter permease [Nitrospirota bacterium]